MPNWTGTWEGGRTYQTKAGRTVYVIRKMVLGNRYQITLDVDSKKQALAQLALFEQDPEAYRTRTQVREDARKEAEEKKARDLELAVTLASETVAKFLDFIHDRTPKYRHDTRRYLAQWGSKLQGRDLRKVEPREIARILSTWKTGEQKRIAALKAFCSFLIKKGFLDPAEDPSRSLTVPPSRPEKALREKGYAMDVIEGIYEHVDDQAVRDVLLLHAKLGLHDSEVQRIARGEGVLTPVGHEEIAGTIRFLHKTGRIHTVSCDREVFAAAQRLQALGQSPTPDRVRWTLAKAAQDADIKLEVRKSRRHSGDETKGKRPPSLNVGELRHSFVAWSLEQGEAITVSGKGVPLALVASVLGHTSTQTTSRFYDVSKVPAMIKLPLRLEHRDDPELVTAAA